MSKNVKILIETSASIEQLLSEFNFDYFMWVSPFWIIMIFKVFLTKEKAILSKPYKVILSEKGK